MRANRRGFYPRPPPRHSRPVRRVTPYPRRVAQYEQELEGDVEGLVAHLDQQILRGSVSANIEDSSDHSIGDARLVVRVYERYSAFGGNRVSLNISILAVGRRLFVTAITAGGSQAVFFKVNTVGEESFLRQAVDALRTYAP